MKALSVRAPWWWFILHAGKNIENRDWGTERRGTIYLHAGKWWSAYGVKAAIYEANGMGALPFGLVFPSDREMMRAGCGCIAGTVDIVDCVKRSASPWFTGEYGLVLANPVAFAQPIPFKGALGFFEVPDNIIISGENDGNRVQAAVPASRMQELSDGPSKVLQRQMPDGRLEGAQPKSRATDLLPSMRL